MSVQPRRNYHWFSAIHSCLSVCTHQEALDKQPNTAPLVERHSTSIIFYVVWVPEVGLMAISSLFALIFSLILLSPYSLIFDLLCPNLIFNACNPDICFLLHGKDPWCTCGWSDLSGKSKSGELQEPSPSAKESGQRHQNPCSLQSGMSLQCHKDLWGRWVKHRECWRLCLRP